MNIIILILTAVVILAGLGYFLLRNKKMEEGVIVPPIVVDPPIEGEVITPPVYDSFPVTEDNTVIIRGKLEYELTKKDLKYSDRDGDKITNVRFSGDIGELYTDKNHTEKYEADTELPIDFKLYMKLTEESRYVIQYNVKSNNLWSK